MGSYEIMFPYGKKKQLAYKKKRKNPKVSISESDNQKQCNDLLEAHQIKYLRIPDWVWGWLKHNAPVSVINELSGKFAGMPDNLPLIKLTDKYSLCLGLELKTEAGRLSTKQKRWQKEVGSIVSRSPDDNIEIVNEFMRDAEIIKGLISKNEEKKL